MAPVRVPQQHRSLPKREGDVAFQSQGAGAVGARREMEQATLRQAVDGRLDGDGIVGHTITQGTEVLHVHPGGDGFGGKGKFLFHSLPGHL